MNYLLLDTSNKPMSLAIMQEDQILVQHTTNLKRNHSSQLMPAIQNILKEAEVEKHELDAIVVAKGPGSYTGLRIGVTTAKTLAYALKTKLYGVSSLAVLAAVIPNIEENILIVPVMDARREAVYTGVYQYKDNQLNNVLEDQYMTIEALNEYLNASGTDYVFVGHDLENVQHLLHGKVIESLPDASKMKTMIQEPEDIHTFKPEYHKLSEAERNWLNNQKS